MGFSRQEYWSGLPLPSPGTMVHHHKLNGRVHYTVKHIVPEMLLVSPDTAFVQLTHNASTEGGNSSEKGREDGMERIGSGRRRQTGRERGREGYRERWAKLGTKGSTSQLEKKATI